MSDLGGTITTLRERYGFSLEDLAKYARVPLARLAAVEGGKSVASVSELYRIADGLAIDPALLRSGTPPDASRSLARFRAPMGIDHLSAHDTRLLARGAELGRIVASLLRVMDRPSSPIDSARSVRAVSPGKAPWRDGYALGKAARLKLAPDQAPFRSLQAWMESQSIHVARVSFDSPGIDAASLYEPGAAPVILLNDRINRTSYPLPRRAILAHELCHLLHDGGERNILTLVSREDDTDAVEQRANAFVPSFLAPAPWVSKDSTNPQQIVVDLASTWGLSFEGAAWHAKNLKLIGAPDATYLSTLLRKPKVNGNFEPQIVRALPAALGIDVEPSQMAEGYLSDLAIAAADEGAISRSRAAEILRFA